MPKVKKNKRRNLSYKDINNEEPPSNAKYYFENGLRKVQPYFYTYKTFAKGRWYEKSIYSIFCKEFQDHTPEYYKKAIETGKIKVNDKIVSPDYLLKNGDVVSHSIHRHEPPVTAEKIEIIEKTEDFLIINKPASIPVHPSGRYNHNTVLHILMNEYGYKKLYPSNRLDRLTSGLNIICLNPEKAKAMEFNLRHKTILKEYLARVVGNFPDEEIVCNEPILTVSFKLGLNSVSPDGKPCTTIFKKLSFNGKTSLVLCKPLTGRTHQIRVHLQYLGYPIANDPLYSKTEIWGEQCGKGGVNKESIDKVIENMMTMGFPNIDTQDINKNQNAETKENANSTIKEEQADKEKERPSWYVESCDDCVHPKSDPKPHQMCIWLHAYSYASNNNADENKEKEEIASTSPAAATAKNETEASTVEEVKKETKESQPNYNNHIAFLKEDSWSFKTSLPDWAKEDFIED